MFQKKDFLDLIPSTTVGQSPVLLGYSPNLLTPISVKMRQGLQCEAVLHRSQQAASQQDCIRRQGLTKAYRGFFLTSIIHGLVLRGSHRGLGRGPKFQERPVSPMDSTRPPGGSVVSRALSSSEEPCSLHKLERFHVRGSGAWTKSLLSSQARGAPSRREGCQRASGAAGWSPSSFPRPCLFSRQRLLLSPPVRTASLSDIDVPKPSGADSNRAAPVFTSALACRVSCPELLFQLLVYPHVSAQFLLQSLNPGLILPLAVC